MTDWPVKTLDALCEEGVVLLGRGNIISKKDIAANPGPFPIYSSARENDGKFGEYGDFMFDEEMITWSIDGGGRLFYRPKHKFSVTNVGGTLRVLNPKVLEIRYLHRALENLHSRKVFDWVFKAHPSVIRKVYDEIPVPPLEEQKRIVALLDAATARVTELTACYEQARTHANNLFTSALSSALEDNPDWPTKTLGDISEISYGYTESAKSEAVGPKFLRITDIKNRGVNWDDVPYCPIDDVQLMRHRLGDGDIVFARTGATTGKSFLVAKPPLAVCASYLIRLRTDKKLVSPDFLNLNFQTNAYWKQVNEGMSGAAQGGFNASKLGALEIPMPTLEEQKRIVAQLDLMRAKTSEMVAAYDAKLQAAKDLRQSILESAFAGDL